MARSRIGAAVIGLVVTGIVLAGILTRSGDPASLDASSTPSANASDSGSSPASPIPASAPPAPELIWHSEPFPGGEVTAAAASDGIWVTLGPGEAWASVNGEVWQSGSIGEFEPPEPFGTVLGAWDIARHGGAWFAVALWDGPADGQAPVIYRSTDGLTWTYLRSKEWWGYGSLALASNDSVLVATSAYYGMGRGSVFVSEDGVSWNEHVAPGGQAAMVDVTASPDRIVAAGGQQLAEGGLIPVVWLSNDGLTWFNSNPIQAPPGRGPLAIGMAPTRGYAMLATETIFPEGCSSNPCLMERILAWRSGDGARWEAATFPDAPLPFGSVYRIEIVPVAGGLVAAAIGGDQPLAWMTSDGTVWEDVGAPFPDGSAVEAIASSGGEVRIFVRTPTGRTVLIGTASQQ